MIFKEILDFIFLTCDLKHFEDRIIQSKNTPVYSIPFCWWGIWHKDNERPHQSKLVEISVDGYAISDATVPLAILRHLHMKLLESAKTLFIKLCVIFLYFRR